MKLLDLYCGAGGAAVGYYRAGFDIVGVDIEQQLNYPFTFYQDDVFEFLRVNKVYFDAIHASPPCQRYSKLAVGTQGTFDNHPDFIARTRKLLHISGVPYIIENVDGSPLRSPTLLCGEMFGLGVLRHRRFETNWPLVQPTHVRHRGRCKRREHGVRHDGPYFGVYGHGGGRDGSIADWQDAMGIDWMSKRCELAQAIPPAYTEFIGGALIHYLQAKKKVELS